MTVSSWPLLSAWRVSLFSFLSYSMLALVPLKSYRTAISCWACTTALCISAVLTSLTMSNEWLSATAGRAPVRVGDRTWSDSRLASRRLDHSGQIEVIQPDSAIRPGRRRTVRQREPESGERPRRRRARSVTRDDPDRRGPIVDIDPGGGRIDDPDQPDPGLEILDDLLLDLVGRIGRADHLDHEVGHDLPGVLRGDPSPLRPSLDRRRRRRPADVVADRSTPKLKSISDFDPDRADESRRSDRGTSPSCS